MFLFSLQTISGLKRSKRERESLRLRATKHTGKIAPQPQTCQRDRIVDFMPPRSSRRDRATWSLLSLDRSRPPLGQIIFSFGSISSFATRRSITWKYFTPWNYFTLKQTQPTTLTNLTGVCWHLPSSIVKIFFASKGYETLMRYKRKFYFLFFIFLFFFYRKFLFLCYKYLIALHEWMNLLLSVL